MRYTELAAHAKDHQIVERDWFLLDNHQPARARWPVGTTVIVDEAGMVGTSKLAELARRADA